MVPEKNRKKESTVAITVPPDSKDTVFKITAPRDSKDTVIKIGQPLVDPAAKKKVCICCDCILEIN